MAALQKPAFVYMNGQLTPWDQATLHIGCEAVTRGLSVFEGIKGYWQPDNSFALLQLKQHFERLQRSAKLLHIPFEHSYEQYTNAIFELMNALIGPERDMWVRTTLYVTDGHWGEGTEADLVLTAYHQDKAIPEPVSLGTSTWRRATDDSLPARIKTSVNYQNGRLARIEGRALGHDDMVLLNQQGRVAEATGAGVLMVRNGVISTPPATENALESLTVDLCEAFAKAGGIPFERRPIERTELLIADEIAICGTLCELMPAWRFETSELNWQSGLLAALRDTYFDAVRNGKAEPSVELTVLPSA